MIHSEGSSHKHEQRKQGGREDAWVPESIGVPTMRWESFIVLSNNHKSHGRQEGEPAAWTAVETKDLSVDNSGGNLQSAFRSTLNLKLKYLPPSSR